MEASRSTNLFIRAEEVCWDGSILPTSHRQNMSTNSWVSRIKPSVSKTLYPSGFTNLTEVLGSPCTNTAKAGMPVLNLTNGPGLFQRLPDRTQDTGTNLGSHNTLTNLDARNTNLSPDKPLGPCDQHEQRRRDCDLPANGGENEHCRAWGCAAKPDRRRRLLSGHQ